MVLSKTCSDAIRATYAIAHLVEERDVTYVPIRDVADEVGMSAHFLGKIVQPLLEAGIWTSYRGPNGGLGLSRSPREISLLAIVAATDGLGVFESCLLGLPQCGGHNPCPVHDRWGALREALQEAFERSSVADGLNAYRQRGRSKPS